MECALQARTCSLHPGYIPIERSHAHIQAPHPTRPLPPPHPPPPPRAGNDWFLLANDFASYMDAQDAVDALYRDSEEWTRRSIIYTASNGFFSSDRTIEQYANVSGCAPGAAGVGRGWCLWVGGGGRVG